MTDLEYAARRAMMAERVLDDVITVIGNALPHTQEQLDRMLSAWQDAINKLNAERSVKAGDA